MSSFANLSGRLPRRLRGPAILILVFLVIEFLDEFVFGAREASWPLIRHDLGLTYAQIGLLLSIPTVIASVIEPVLGILADVWKRRLIVLVGGILFAAALVFMAASLNFAALMVSFILLYPASGAFVSLSQSTLMDTEPTRHEQNMTRWEFAGAAGVLVGSVALGLCVAVGFGWRIVFLAGAVLSLIIVVRMSRMSFPRIQANPADEESDEESITFKAGVRNAISALRRPDVLRWLVLLEFGNLMLDILYGYLALYFVDVVGTGKTEATFAVSVWTGIGLLGNFLLIPLLERVRGLSYVRFSALLELILFPIFLLVPSIPVKLVILGALGFFNSGWYSVLQGQLYTAMPGQSGTVLSLVNVSGLFGGLIPLVIGFAAERFGLGVAMWALLLGPIMLTIGLPRQQPAPGGDSNEPLAE